MSYFTNQVVWITGASSGIGEALVYAFAKENAKIILSARREKELIEVQKKAGLTSENSMILTLDLEKNKDYTNEADAILKKFGKIDQVIHNGGVSQRSLVKDTKLSVFRRIIEINYLGAVSLTLSTLPIFQKQKSGQYTVITSIVGKIGSPLRSGYSGSKHALHGFFDSLRAEEWGNGIRVLLVTPGYIQTQVSVNALVGDGKNQGTMDEAQAQGIPAEICAQKILKAIQNGKEEIVIARLREELATYLKRFFPKTLSKILRNAKVT